MRLLGCKQGPDDERNQPGEPPFPLSVAPSFLPRRNTQHSVFQGLSVSDMISFKHPQPPVNNKNMKCRKDKCKILQFGFKNL